MKKKMLEVGIVAFLLLLLVIIPASAWGASQNVAAVDDYSPVTSDRVISESMGSVWYSDYESTIPGLDMVTVEPADINAANLANYDTLFLFACNPSVFSDSQKADINAFVANGGKLIIWDSEDPGQGNSWNYNWLATPFTAAVPGAQGATGILDIVEENMLSSDNPASTYYINAAALGTQTDAVGDANVFAQFIPSQWCIDMTADSVLSYMDPYGAGPTHVYTKSVQSGGIVLYCGLDWDYANYQGWSGGVADNLKKILKNELTASSLPCASPPPTNLLVTKASDKTQYAVGDIVVFTITVNNPSPTYTAEDVALLDYPPSEVVLTSNTGTLGDLAPGETKTYEFRGEAVTEGCDLENSVVATGYFAGNPFFNGGDTIEFDIGTNCGGTPVPEFPTLAVPVVMILGFAFLIYSRKN
jgi:uncharacterized repeat protein (TIGR01451 family)